jgi:hypothetical protein
MLSISQGALFVGTLFWLPLSDVGTGTGNDH